MATLLVRRRDRRAFSKKSIRTAPDTKGKVWAFTAGTETPATTRTRFGSLPEVRNIAVDAMMNPIARIPARSSSDKKALKLVSEYHLLRSLGVINARLALIAFSITQV
jgi:hypothetical protein